MFGFSKRDKEKEEMQRQIEDLWFCHNNLAALVQQITELMKQMADGVNSSRDDFDNLAQQTLKIAETQNRILAHLSGRQVEDYLAKDFLGTIH